MKPQSIPVHMNAKKEDISNRLTSNLQTIGVRIPNNEIALNILKNIENLQTNILQ